MPEQHGWCIPCRADQPATSERRCTACGHILIPPSWSHRSAQYPWPARPDGWSWSPPKVPEPKPEKPAPAPKAVAMPAPAKPKATKPPVARSVAVRRVRQQPSRATTITFTCARCRVTVTRMRRGGKPQQRCSEPCRRKTPRAAVEAKATGIPETIVCVVCAVTAPALLPQGGRRTKFCSVPCQNTFHKTKFGRQTMAARGLTCVDCGRDDVPHKSRGRCDGCWKRWRRQQIKTNQEPSRQRVCVICNASFTLQDEHPTQVACSPSCGARLREQRKRRGAAA